MRDDLRQVMTPENFSRWFAPTVARGLIDGELCVQVQDPFHLGWLRPTSPPTRPRGARAPGVY